MWTKWRLCSLKPLRLRGAVVSGTLVLLAAGSSLSGAEPPRVARWVDADGVVQFGHPQFAPADHDPVFVKPANGMAPAIYTGPDERHGPVIHQLERNHTTNKRGFRGHHNRRNHGTRKR